MRSELGFAAEPNLQRLHTDKSKFARWASTSSIVVSDLSHRYAIPSRGFNLKLLDRDRDCFLLVASDHCAKHLGTLTDYVNTPAGHQSQPRSPSYYTGNSYDGGGDSDSNGCIQKDGSSLAIASWHPTDYSGSAPLFKSRCTPTSRMLR
jgi:hypothetical protein